MVLAAGTGHIPRKVPSGAQAGIKVKGPWDVVACSQTSLVVDFDARKSIW